MVEVAAYVLRSLSAPEARDLTLSLVPVLEKVVRDKQDRFSLPKWQAARDGLKRHQAVAELEHLEGAGLHSAMPRRHCSLQPVGGGGRNPACGEAASDAFVCIRTSQMMTRVRSSVTATDAFAGGP